ARLVLTQPAPVPDVKGEAVTADLFSPSIYYRGVRPVQIAVYTLSPTNKPRLAKQSLEFVVGRRSPTMAYVVQNSKWANKSLGVTFTDGLLTKVSSENESELAGAAEALRGLPAEYLAAIKQANEIVSEQNKLDSSGIQRQIDDLKKQKELTETRITSGETANLAAMKTESDRLEAELKLLNSQRNLAVGQAIPQDQTALSAQVQIIKLQNDLAEAQVKQLQLQQQLDELRQKMGGGQ